MERKHKFRLIKDEIEGGWGAFETARFHPGEDLKHHICKCITAYLVQDAGRDVIIEAETQNGYIDVLDLGESDEPARAIELETSYSPEKGREKLAQYQSPLIGDVITIDISEAPDDINELEAWLRTRLLGV